MSLIDQPNSISYEQAFLAVRRLSAKIPMLTSFARALTGDDKMRVEVTKGTPRTDGKTIYLRPEPSLGIDFDHDRPVCGIRDADGNFVCVACKQHDNVMAVLFHEISHIAFGTFDTANSQDKMALMKALIKERPSTKGKRLAKLQEIVNDIETTGYCTWNGRRERATYILLGHLIGEYFPILVNALEDARVNKAMFEARPGTYNTFSSLSRTIFRDGFKLPDGTLVRWIDRPDNMQVIIGLYCIASGYDITGWFSPAATTALADPKLNAILRSFAGVRSVAGVYRFAFPILERLRELGFCQAADDIADDPPPLPPVQPPAQPDPSEASDDKNEDDETDDQDQDTNSEGDESPDTDEPADSSDSGTERPDADDEASPADEEDEDQEADEPDTEGPDAGDDGDPEDSTEPAAGDDESGDDVDDDSIPEGGSSDYGDDDESPEGDAELADDKLGGDDDDNDELDDENDSSGTDDETLGEGDPSEEEDPEESSDGDDDDDLDSGDASEITDDRPQDGEGSQNDDDEQSAVDNESDGLRDPLAHPTSDEPVGLDDKAAEERKQDDPDEIAKALQDFMGHPETPDDQSPEDQAIEELLNQAVQQAQHFDTPSETVAGVRIISEQTEGQGWSPYGNRDTFKPEESMIGPVVQKLRTVFADNKRARRTPGLRSGRVTSNQLHTVATGNKEIFNRTLRPAKKDYYVAVALDISGSTRMGRTDYVTGRNTSPAINYIKSMTFAIAEVMARLGVTFEVLAHSGGYDYSERRMDVEVYQVKDANEPWSNGCRDKLSSLHGFGGNLDGHMMEFLRKRCEQRSETDKVIIYVTDGQMPETNYEDELVVLTRELKTCKQRDYAIVGVGIGTDSPSQYGLTTVCIDAMSDINKMVRELQKQLGAG